MFKTAILAVMLGIACAQDAHRGRFQYQQQRQQQYQPQQQQHQQPAQQPAQQQYQPQQQEQRQYQEPSSQAQLDRRVTTTPIPILQWNKQQEHDGTYRASYETGNNIIAEEQGYIKSIGEGEDRADALVQRGSYSYTSPDGQIISIQYVADETGFRATGDHLPTPPPVSEEIQKGLDLIYAGIRQREEDEAREASRGGNQPIQRHEIDHSGRYRP